jgi:hypothetical protein
MIILNAKVKITIVNYLPKIIINNQYEHTFNIHSNLYKLFKTKGIKYLQSKLNNGYFFIIDDNLIDFRYNTYDGYICNNPSKLIEKLGYLESTSPSLRKSLHMLNINNDYLTIQLSQQSPLIFAAYIDDPDEYETGVCYNWSPFQNYIRCIPYLRYISTDLYYFHNDYKKIPLKSDWEKIILSNDANIVVNKQFEELLDKLNNIETDKNDIQKLLTLAQLNKDEEAIDYFSNMKDLDDRTKYDSFMYVLELSGETEQFGHGFKYIKELFNGIVDNHPNP